MYPKIMSQWKKAGYRHHHGRASLRTGGIRCRVDLVEYAKQFVGNPYVWGGTSLTKGADCSGFVLSVFKKYGITLSHSSRAQANEGTKISASELKPGDLVFYGNGKGNINHVAIYIGGGQVIHASSPKTGIKISSYKVSYTCEMCPCHSRLIKALLSQRAGQCFFITNRVGDSLLDYSKICAGSFFYNCVSQGSMILFLYTSAVPDRKRGFVQRRKWVRNMRKVALITDGWRRLFTLCLAGRYFAENQREGRRKFIYF